MKKKIFDRIASYLTQSPTRFFFVAAITAFFVLWFVNEYLDPRGFDWHDVIVESHGVFFDLLVFGIFLSIYERIRDKKDKIERYMEEIDDYRNWKEKEATFRLIGLIKRLNKLGVFNIDLSSAYLEEAQLSNINLNNSTLFGATLAKAKINKTKCSNSNFKMSDLTYVIFQDTDLSNNCFDSATITNGYFKNVDLQGSSFFGTQLNRVYFIDVNLQNCSFLQANLMNVNFINVKVDLNWFEKLKASWAEGVDAIMSTYYIDEEGYLKLKKHE